ncbi:hypothetical protein [uncultured Methanobrevibacter sp.]|uniref:hypothetical protein n=1 Tax=uncultured Methanobrevibacter sp. TaxID=253161 RepID=UPI0025D2A7CA|nr:hypothetical protein [uncultured Methanobrevibacter sp.]
MDDALTSSSKFEYSVIETFVLSTALTALNKIKNVSTIDRVNVLFFIEIFPPLGSHYENFIVKYDYTNV